MAIELKRNRPISITILAWLYIVVGALGTAAHYADFRTHRPALNEIVWITVLGVAAIVAGVFMREGRNWARWLALLWMATHVVISAFHPLRELIIHGALFVLIAYLLFRREAREFFNAA